MESPKLQFYVIILFLSCFYGYILYRSSVTFELGLFGMLFATLLLVLFYPTVLYYDTRSSSLLNKSFYFWANILIAFLFFYFSLLFIGEVIHIFYPIYYYSLTIYSLLLFSVLLTAVSYYNHTLLVVKQLTLERFGKKSTFVQLSDIHLGTLRQEKYLKRVLDKTLTLNPEFIIITGDIVDGNGKMKQQWFEPLKNVKVPIYFCMGNHDFYEGEDRVEKYLRTVGVIVLRNKTAKINGIDIVGLDYTPSEKQMHGYLDTLPKPQKATLLLNHLPIGYNHALKKGYSIQFSGHTHNGQIIPFNLFVKLKFPKIMGLYKMGNYRLYVSPGTSTWGPPLRLGSRNEITLVNTTV